MTLSATRSNHTVITIPPSLPLVVVTLLVSLLITLTGGIASPLKMFFLLPVLLGGVQDGFRGSLSAALLVCLFAVVIHSSPLSFFFVTENYLFLQLLGFAGLTLCIALTTEQWQKKAAYLEQQAEELQRQAQEVEWFDDTVTMMQSVHSTEEVLSVALLRLREQVSFDAAAVFLRNAQGNHFELVQSLGLTADYLPCRRATVSVLALPFLSRLAPSFAWATSEQHPSGFMRIDPASESGIVVALQTWDERLGLLYLSANHPGGFSDSDRLCVEQFAHHIMAPVQQTYLRDMSVTDTLTGLYNRRAFDTKREIEVERSHRYNSPLTLLLLDIDYFKQVNDCYGHAAGDSVLSQLGLLLRENLRASDFAARYGGEEIALLCPQTSADEGEILAERLRQTIAAAQFHLSEGRLLSITVSIGIGTLAELDSNGTKLVQSADTALYKAKSAGRNCIVRQ